MALRPWRKCSAHPRSHGGLVAAASAVAPRARDIASVQVVAASTSLVRSARKTSVAAAASGAHGPGATSKEAVALGVCDGSRVVGGARVDMAWSWLVAQLESLGVGVGRHEANAGHPLLSPWMAHACTARWRHGLRGWTQQRLLLCVRPLGSGAQGTRGGWHQMVAAGVGRGGPGRGCVPKGKAVPGVGHLQLLLLLQVRLRRVHGHVARRVVRGGASSVRVRLALRHEAPELVVELVMVYGVRLCVVRGVPTVGRHLCRARVGRRQRLAAARMSTLGPGPQSPGLPHGRVLLMRLRMLRRASHVHQGRVHVVQEAVGQQGSMHGVRLLSHEHAWPQPRS
mmetsp:Transcript_12504/g.37537  ORF Transcript_12504/g.37537 Transcript_12504/m.37537 type:complete len:340 (-) Transcript_12504:1531-2550(-)